MQQNLTNEHSETEQDIDSSFTEELIEDSMDSIDKPVKQIKDVILNLVSMRDVRKLSFRNIFGLDNQKSERMDKLINKKEYDKEELYNKNIKKASTILEIEKNKLLLF